MSEHETVEEYLEYIEEKYADVKQATINNAGTRIWVEMDHDSGIGSHFTSEMLGHGFALRSTGGGTVEFDKIEISARFATEVTPNVNN